MRQRSRRRRFLFISLLAIVVGLTGASVALTTGCAPERKEPILTITERSEWSTNPPAADGSVDYDGPVSEWSVLFLEGLVRNDGPEPVPNIYIVARIFRTRDDGTTAMGTAEGYVEDPPRPLQPGESRDFILIAPGPTLPERTDITAETRELPAVR